MHPALTDSATSLAAQIRRRERSSVEVVQAHIDRIEVVNPAVNAVVADRFEAALREAHAADARVAAGGELPPLLGVPCTIKEFIGVRGMPQTAGILARRHAVATTDATVVRRLRRAGAVVLGVTNAPEGGLWHETNNPVHGRTSNPHDLWRTPGGSSGGEGAIIAAGGSPFGIGSDTGGSIRIPAAFCGIAGHKPTGGLVPLTGHFPHTPDRVLVPTVIGPLARRACDLRPLVQILAGPDGIDRSARSWPLGDAEVDWSTVEVMPLPHSDRVHVRPEVASAVHRAALALRELGARVVPYRGPDLSRSFELWAGLLADSEASYDDLLRPDVDGGLLGEVFRFPLGRSRHAGGVLALLAIEQLLGRLPSSVSQLASEAVALRDALDEALGPRTLVIHPVYPRGAPRHRGMVLRNPLDVACTTAFNLTESPVTVVPVDVDANGMPLGVQLVARRGHDALTLAAGEALEQVLGPPKVVDPHHGRRSPSGLRLA